MPAPFRRWTKAEFLDALLAYPWRRRIWRVDMHHTFRPDHARWREIGSAGCQDGMCRFHVADLGWADIAQHVSIMPDGGVFMFEAVGNFDEGCDRLEGAQLDSVLFVIRSVQKRFALPPEALLFHREVPQTEKTCPGTSVEKSVILSAIRTLPVARVTALADLRGLPLEPG